MLPYLLFSLYSANFSITPPSDTPKVFQSVQNIPAVPQVPLYSQFKDISSPEWRKVGCGVTSLAMVIDFYEPNTVTVNTLLRQGINDGAYISGAGWSHQGLVRLAQKYELTGKTYDFSASSNKTAFAVFKNLLKDGPIIVSVHYKLDPENPIPHLVVINGIDSNTVYYNDPAENVAGKEISITEFLKAWKKRFIVIRPPEENNRMMAVKN